MALRPCGECGQAISERARTCPHCGISMPFQLSAQRSLEHSLNALRHGSPDTAPRTNPHRGPSLGVHSGGYSDTDASRVGRAPG